jgi:uncharacterized protein
MRVAWVLAPWCLAGCAQLGTPSPGVLPADVHAMPDARELAEHPCRYGEVARCVGKCEKEGGQACNAAGVFFEFGDRGDPALASSYYGRACDGSYGPGCNNLAWLYLRGNGVRHDPPHAMVLFLAAFDAARIACSRGDADGCLLAGELLYDGRGVDRREDEAIALFRRACAGGQARACELARDGE